MHEALPFTPHPMPKSVFVSVGYVVLKGKRSFTDKKKAETVSIHGAMTLQRARARKVFSETDTRVSGIGWLFSPKSAHGHTNVTERFPHCYSGSCASLKATALLYIPFYSLSSLIVWYCAYSARRFLIRSCGSRIALMEASWFKESIRRAIYLEISQFTYQGLFSNSGVW